MLESKVHTLRCDDRTPYYHRSEVCNASNEHGGETDNCPSRLDAANALLGATDGLNHSGNATNGPSNNGSTTGSGATLAWRTCAMGQSLGVECDAGALEDCSPLGSTAQQPV